MKVKNPTGRVDYLLSRLIEEAVKRSRNPIAAKVYEQVRPVIDQTLTRKIGPRTRRGKTLVRQLFTVRELAQRAQQRGLSV